MLTHLHLSNRPPLQGIEVKRATKKRKFVHAEEGNPQDEAKRAKEEEEEEEKEALEEEERGPPRRLHPGSDCAEDSEAEGFPSAEDLLEQFELAELPTVQPAPLLPLLPPLPVAEQLLPGSCAFGPLGAASSLSVQQLDALLAARLVPIQQQLQQLLQQQQAQHQAAPLQTTAPQVPEPHGLEQPSLEELPQDQALPRPAPEQEGPQPAPMQALQLEQQPAPAPPPQPEPAPAPTTDMPVDDASLLDVVLATLADDPSALTAGSLPMTSSLPAPARERLLAAIAAALGS